MAHPMAALPNVEHALSGLKPPVAVAHAQYAFRQVLFEAEQDARAFEQALLSLRV
jgi:hypothetical protein